MKVERVGVLFVCLGNICRSPLAEGVFSKLARERGLDAQFHADSCGTSTWHEGEAAHPAARAVAQRNGFDIEAHVARQVSSRDFEAFRYILAMDRANLRHLERMAPGRNGPTLDLLLRFGGLEEEEVPDPYHADAGGFQACLDLIRGGAEGVLRRIAAKHFAPAESA
ncbi:MAG TPA: low molecular weight protein-tyrosine-phosphatase [Sphingomonadales bacterium]|nr:low molecular weight protein-tyrosine-phosphatase [Sphingomonadales bacterium]